MKKSLGRFGDSRRCEDKDEKIGMKDFKDEKRI
jgi:hypothetical protein